MFGDGVFRRPRGVGVGGALGGILLPDIIQAVSLVCRPTQWPVRLLRGLCVVNRSEEAVHRRFGLFLGEAVVQLNGTNQGLEPALGFEHIVVGKLGPLGMDEAFDLQPVAGQGFAIHGEGFQSWGQWSVKVSGQRTSDVHGTAKEEKSEACPPWGYAGLLR